MLFSTIIEPQLDMKRMLEMPINLASTVFMLTREHRSRSLRDGSSSQKE